MHRIALTLIALAPLALLGGCATTNNTPNRIIADSSSVTVYNDCDPVFRYRYDAVTYKPYVDALWTPGVVNIVRDRPSDHLHHHGMMMAFNVDGVNYWEESKEHGRQVHRGKIGRYCKITPGCSNVTGIQGRIDWIDPDDNVALLEDRTIESVKLTKCEKPVSLLNWHSKFQLPEGKDSADIGGAFYVGLGTRFVESIDSSASFFNAAGAKNNDETYMKPADWCALHATAGGKPMTYAMFEPHQLNNRPSTWFTNVNVFAYMSATWMLHEEPMTIKAGEPLEWFYGIAVWEGHITAEEIDATYKLWRESLGSK